MAFENLTGPKSLQASADLSAYQFRFVKLDSNAQLALNTTAGGRVLSVLQDKPTAQGEPGQICGPGSHTKIKAGGVIAAGGLIASSNEGKAVAATTGAHILGYNAGPVSADGDIITMVFQPDGTL
jgi:hypothetical protein